MARANPHPSYDVTSNTYILKRQGLKDKHWQTEIGDISETARFQPRFLVRRWLDDANFGLDLPSNFLGGGDSVTHDGEAIVWKRSNVTARFFDWTNDPNDLEGNGSYEWEIVFANTLPSNSITLPIRRKNIVLEYQPPLTPEEISDGFTRPPRVEGSYAVYSTTKRGKRPGDPIDYQTGKIGHLYRPLVRDNAGRTTWATFNADAQTTGTLTVTIDPVWLAAASYPVTIDPTFGYTTAGASTFGHNATKAYALRTAGHLYTASSGDTLTTLHSYCKRDYGTGNLNLGLYTVSGGAPNTKVGDGYVGSPGTGAAWRQTSDLNLSLSASTTYSVAGTQTGVYWSQYYDTSTGTNYSRDDTLTGGVFNATWTESATHTHYLSLYGSYKSQITKTVSASARLVATITKTVGASALLAAAGAITVTSQASARIVARLTAATSGSARLFTRTALTVSASALLVAQPTVTTGASAHLLKQSTLTSGASAHLLTQSTVATEASAALIKQNTVDTGASARLLKQNTTQVLASALLKTTPTVTASSSAHLLATVDLTTGASARLVNRLDVSTGGSAHTLVTVTLPVDASARLLKQSTRTVSASARLSNSRYLIPIEDLTPTELTTSGGSTHFNLIDDGDTGTYDVADYVGLAASDGVGLFSKSDRFSYRDVPLSERKGTITKIIAHTIANALDSSDPSEIHIFWLNLVSGSFSSTAPSVDPYNPGGESDFTYEVDRKSAAPGGFFSYDDVNAMTGRYYMTLLAPAAGSGWVRIYDAYLELVLAGDLTSSVPRLNSPPQASIWLLETGASASLTPFSSSKTQTVSASAHLIDESGRIWKGVVDGVHQYFKSADAALVSMFADGTITDTNLSQLVTWLASVEFEATIRDPLTYGQAKFPRVHIFTGRAQTVQDETGTTIGVDPTAVLTVWTQDADPTTAASQNVAICGALAAFVHQTYAAPGTDWMSTHPNWGIPSARVLATEFLTYGDMIGLCRGVVEVNWSHRDYA